ANRDSGPSVPNSDAATMTMTKPDAAGRSGADVTSGRAGADIGAMVGPIGVPAVRQAPPADLASSGARHSVVVVRGVGRIRSRRQCFGAGRFVARSGALDRGERDPDLAEDLDRHEEAGEQEQDTEELAELEPLGHAEAVKPAP